MLSVIVSISIFNMLSVVPYRMCAGENHPLGSLRFAYALTKLLHTLLMTRARSDSIFKTPTTLESCH